MWFLHVCVCVCVRVRACMRACVRACVRVCGRSVFPHKPRVIASLSSPTFLSHDLSSCFAQPNLYDEWCEGAASLMWLMEDASTRLTTTSHSVGISAPDRSTHYSQQWYKGERGHAEGDQINYTNMRRRPAKGTQQEPLRKPSGSV